MKGVSFWTVEGFKLWSVDGSSTRCTDHLIKPYVKGLEKYAGVVIHSLSDTMPKNWMFLREQRFDFEMIILEFFKSV